MLGFFSVTGGSVASVVDAATDAVAVQDYRIIEEDSDGTFVQLELQRPLIATVLAEHGVMLKSMTADESGDDGPMNELTDRQLENLRTAYHAGYFEVPRQCDGQTVADMLDITSPTFHQHRRLGINAILQSLLDD